MAVRKRQKRSRQRGSHTHGCGSKKKARGSGNKGGVGMAGTGKRAHAKKPSVWGIRYFGRFGRSREDAQGAVVNVGDLHSLAAGQSEIDLTKLGITKLLGRGSFVGKITVTVAKASPQAKEKIEKAGGSVHEQSS